MGRIEVEIASEELISESEREKTRKVLSDLCAEACASVSASEARATAKAVFHDAVSAAAKEVAAGIAEESIPIAREIVAGMLKDAGQHPYIETCVLEATQPVARHGALAAVRKWSEEKALPLAEEAAKHVFVDHIENGYQPVLQTLVFSNLRTILENKVASNPQISSAEKDKLLADFLNDQARTAALEAAAKGINAELRRQAQAAAQRAIEEVAAQATDLIAREDALAAARVVAVDTAKMEISRLVLAEAQRRAAKLTRERLQDEASKQEEEKRAEFCQNEARKIADEAVESVTQEIADPSVADLDLAKARELALAASTAVAREFSGAYQLTMDEDVSTVNTKTIAFLIAQVSLGCMIIWFFLFGGAEVCQPLMKKILPPVIYYSIYKPDPSNSVSPGNSSNEVDELLDEPQGSGKDSIDDVPAVKPVEPELAPAPENSEKNNEAVSPENTQQIEQQPKGSSPSSEQKHPEQNIH